ncbi:hypothetical protein Rleg2_0077 [Rhizobium leguminosarum bv. trifolii WSM2304]|uniref:Uncharacterized protein n=1 Tax=Rhizobium leguminosarum bv. trifolii (strain WSM2304) TaxID=395492 RepID=A0ABF7QHP2_RHILW|nr:hypothetical protein Rleg2_0077 [Rhizobium leguminosarum bv. trifolii WSM2304]
MTETFSKSRQRAEIAFGNVQTQFFAKNKAVEELESDVQSQQAKTLRLREARLSKGTQRPGLSNGRPCCKARPGRLTPHRADRELILKEA